MRIEFVKGGMLMKRLLTWWALLATCGMSLCAEANVATDDDDEYEEIVIRRRKPKKPTVAAQVALPVATPPLASPAPDAPPPPPEPPAAEAAEPRRLVRYFCKAWKDQEWERMWWAMNPQYRKKVSLKKFKKLFVDDAEGNGGLMDENVIEEGKTNAGVGVKVELIFTFKNAKHRVVKAEVQRVPGGQYRLVDSPIIPMDMDDL